MFRYLDRAVREGRAPEGREVELDNTMFPDLIVPRDAPRGVYLLPVSLSVVDREGDDLVSLGLRDREGRGRVHAARQEDDRRPTHTCEYGLVR